MNDQEFAAAHVRNALPVMAQEVSKLLPPPYEYTIVVTCLGRLPQTITSLSPAAQIRELEGLVTALKEGILVKDNGETIYMEDYQE